MRMYLTFPMKNEAQRGSVIQGQRVVGPDSEHGLLGFRVCVFHHCPLLTLENPAPEMGIDLPMITQT